MRFRKPVRSVAVQLGPYYRAKRRRAYASFAAKALGAAAAGGLFAGALSVPSVRQRLSAAATAYADPRARAPQPSDRWTRCAEARAAGTAPIFAGEPGYRDGLDSDGDGVACEPYRGR